MPARDLEPDSDLGTRLVTTDVGVLTPEEIAQALASGVEEAERMRSHGLIAAAALCLHDRVATVAAPVLASAARG